MTECSPGMGGRQRGRAEQVVLGTAQYREAPVTSALPYTSVPVRSLRAQPRDGSCLTDKTIYSEALKDLGERKKQQQCSDRKETTTFLLAFWVSRKKRTGPLENIF